MLLITPVHLILIYFLLRDFTNYEVYYYGLKVYEDIKYLGENIFKAIENLLKKYNINNVGVNINEVKYNTLNHLKKYNIKLLDSSNVFKNVVMYKSNNEIHAIKKAIEVTEHILNEIQFKIKPNVRECEIYTEIIHKIIELGYEFSFKPIVAANINASYPHAIVSENSIRENDVLIIDIGIKYLGYSSDITRTFIVGKYKEVEDNLEILINVKREVCKKIHAKTKCSELHEYAISLLREYKLDKYFNHGLGHGLGLSVHEPPSISIFSTELLDNNMVFTIEPGIYIPRMYGIRIEDDYTIYDNMLVPLSKEYNNVIYV